MQAGGLAWYGGGCDLTPSYLFEEDAAAFHAFWRGVCDRHDPGRFSLALYHQFGSDVHIPKTPCMLGILPWVSSSACAWPPKTLLPCTARLLPKNVHGLFGA